METWEFVVIILIEVNHKICSDSFPIPNIQSVLHALVGTKYFTKIYLKLDYNLIQIDKKFKKVTTTPAPRFITLDAYAVQDKNSIICISKSHGKYT